MPTRSLPKSNPNRYKAINTAKELKDMVPPPPFIPFTAATIVRMDTFLPLYKAKIEAAETALQGQLTLSPLIKEARQQAEYLISDIYSALQRAIRRKKFLASVRPPYGLKGNDANLPRIKSEADITYWAGKASAGEAARVAAGGDPISFPPIAEMDLAVSTFKDLSHQQDIAQLAYDAAQEAIAADNPEADKLILKMWNEIETAFDEGDKPSMRRKARHWGVVYVPTPGETPTPEDFSIVGKATEAGTGNPLADVDIKVQETGETVTTDSNGDYFIGLLADGSYTLLVKRSGFADLTLPGISVVAGTLTTVNIQMTPQVATGTITGTVRQAGMPAMGATVAVEGFPALVTSTDMDGKFTLSDVPTGPHQLKAQLAPPAADPFKSQPVNVVAGMEVAVDFWF